MSGWFWSLMTVLGPVLLLAAIGWATLRNRNPAPGEIARAERGARDLREEIEDDEARDSAP
jgi:hypothetical protein